MTGTVSDLSIPLQFDGPQPNHFGAEPAHAEPMNVPGFVGDTRKGGSCNAVSLTLNPHCNGTHTECVGHLTTSRVSINDVCPVLPMLAGLVSTPVSPTTYNDEAVHSITRENVQDSVTALFAQTKALAGTVPTALIIRTLPNSSDKKSKHYRDVKDAAFMQPEAVAWLVAQGIDHLLVDLPSIDPYSDHGALEAHRILFGLPEAARCPSPTLADAKRAHATLTELIYVPDNVDDGLYLLSLQTPPFCLDVAPSRPLLYSLESA